MSNESTAAILQAFAELRVELRSELREILADVLAPVHDKLESIESEARRTNGRVRRLEAWRERLAGARMAIGTLPVLFACVGSIAAITVALTH